MRSFFFLIICLLYGPLDFASAQDENVNSLESCVEQATLTDVQNNLERLEHERQLALDEINALRNSFSQRTQEVDGARHSLEECQLNLNDVSMKAEQVSLLKQQLNEKQQELATVYHKNTELDNLLETVRIELKEFQAQFDQATKSLQDSEAIMATTGAERIRLQEDVKRLFEQVEKAKAEKLALTELLATKETHLKSEFEKKLERMWAKEQKKQDVLHEKLRVAQEQLAASKDSLFEARRELHNANEELRFQRRFSNAYADAKDRLRTLYKEDPLGVVGFYQEHVHHVVQQILAVAVPASILIKDTTIYLVKEASIHIAQTWKENVKPFLLTSWKDHIKPGVTKAWDYTGPYRTLADKKFQSSMSKLMSHPFWQDYPQFGHSQQWLKEKTCIGTDVLSSYVKLQSNRTESLPVFLSDTSDLMHTQCENLVVVGEGMFVTVAMMSLVSWLLSLTSSKSSKSSKSKKSKSKSDQRASQVLEVQPLTKAAQRKMVRAKALNK